MSIINTTKECLDCGQIKNIDCFCINRSKRDNLNIYCKDCQHIRRLKSYDKSKEKEKKRHYEYIKKNREKINQMSSKRKLISRNSRKKRIIDAMGGKCEICNYDRCIAALEFHHNDPNTKEFNISEAFRRGMYDEQVVIEEAKKCKLLCANCHREIHNL